MVPHLKSNHDKINTKKYNEKSHIAKFAYKKQRNLFTNLLQVKREYFGKLDHKKISDNKIFWKTVKPLFSEKKSTEAITLVETNQIIDNPIAHIFNDVFCYVNKNLGIVNTLLTQLYKYTNHQSVRKIIVEEQNDSFSFKFTSYNIYKLKIST